MSDGEHDPRLKTTTSPSLDNQREVVVLPAMGGQKK